VTFVRRLAQKWDIASVISFRILKLLYD